MNDAGSALIEAIVFGVIALTLLAVILGLKGLNDIGSKSYDEKSDMRQWNRRLLWKHRRVLLARLFRRLRR